MRIAIVGGGVAGLISAWLLEEEHEVTLFEAGPRLGGHADTCQFEVAGQPVAIDGGFEFFSERMFPRFCRLLDGLRVPQRQYPLTLTVYSLDQRRPTLLPPWRDGRPVWSACGPRQLGELLQLRRVLRRARGLMEAEDVALTIEQFLETVGVSRRFLAEFMFPLLLSGWCLPRDEFRGFAAYDVLRYMYLHQPTGLRPALWREIVGGTQTYIRALTAALARTQVGVAREVVEVRPAGVGYEIVEADGRRTPCDQVVLATNAADARRLLEPCGTAGATREVLSRFGYFETTIAIHGDARLLPRERRHWSVVNVRRQVDRGWTTIYKPWANPVPVFKTWISGSSELPEPLYRRLVYRHARVTPDYFAAQRALEPHQGRAGLWLAGMYTQGVDCHESALHSAIRVADRLAPESARLRQLRG